MTVNITAMIFLHIILHSAVYIYDFHIFITSSSFQGFITNQFNDLLPVGVLAKLVERCTGNSEVKGSNPVEAFFSGFLFATAKVAYTAISINVVGRKAMFKPRPKGNMGFLA